MSKSLIAKKENEITERGLQRRGSDPVTPLSQQLWVNTTTNQLKFYDGVVKTIIDGYVEGNAPSKLVELSLLDIDWSAGSFFRKRNTAGTVNFTFSNIVAGKSIVLLVISDTFSSTTVNLPAGTKLVATDNYTLIPGKGIAIELTRIDSETYAKIIFRADIAQFPTGVQGDLTIVNGQTVNIADGAILDYQNIDIQAGGILNIVGGSGGAITTIGCNGTMTIDGIIRGNDGTFGTSTFSTITPLGESLSYTVVRRAGGAGGGGGGPQTSSGGSSSTPTGSGGGGGGGGSVHYRGGTGGTGGAAGGVSPYNEAPVRRRGSGGSGNSTLGNGNNGGAAPNSLQGGNGGNGGGSGGGGGGVPVSGSGSPTYGAGGGGGGGAYRGKQGLGLVIIARNPILGSGQVQLNGTNGFEGGNGGAAVVGSQGTAGSGGGGGGGGGGSGGALWVRCPAPFSVPYTVSGGAGGPGGTRGTASVDGVNGQAGQAGLTGTFNYSV